MIYVLYFILSAIVILLTQEITARSGTACWEWEDVKLPEPKKKFSRKRKNRHAAEIIPFDSRWGKRHNTADSVGPRYCSIKAI